MKLSYQSAVAMAGAGYRMISCSQTPCLYAEGNVNGGGGEALPHYHETVLLEESVDAMLAGPGKVLVDGTLGGGGHTGLMLERGAEVYAIDRDPEAHAYAGKRLEKYGDRFRPVVGNFADALELLRERRVEQVDGWLVDLGVSSRQFDCDERGFSFQKEGPLDMRMGPSSPLTAADIVNTWSEQELARVFWEYGEERASRKIAKYICEQRALQPYTTTTQFAASIEKLIPRYGKKIHPATKVFQALRIEVNDELGALKQLLETAADLLAPGGRLCVISFHSLEDRMVKRFLKHASMQEIDRPEWPEPRPNPDYHFKAITRKPIKATAEEIQRNPRSRSAVLRVGERI
ncbi:16S rRNA (cytosine(1402)-N(4))-methyltransferase RsmH [Rubritalea spongiae]|uniref:Ribosomal RNA small subunit methyltransferase H n=1 Tax=Rubritalea spongiae TaxID=430797 RepID=A0ABW5E485_9BACT